LETESETERASRSANGAREVARSIAIGYGIVTIIADARIVSEGAASVNKKLQKNISRNPRIFM